MHRFLSDHRDELIARCKAKVARRPHRVATAQQLANGIPMFLTQLAATLQAEADGASGEIARISGVRGDDDAATTPSEMSRSAAAHGQQLLDLGYSVDQVVHDYGDLCQAITDLAVELNAPVTVDHFRTLNRCLDMAIADAVAAFSVRREANAELRHSREGKERLGVLVHELRNLVQSATLAFSALAAGSLPVGGATGGVLKRSLSGLSGLLSKTLEEVRVTSGAAEPGALFSLAAFIADAKAVASLDAGASSCGFAVPVVDPTLGVVGNRDRLMAALVNLLQNAFKFTRALGEVSLQAYARADRVLIDVRDGCGGLPPGIADRLFEPFVQGAENKSGLGLGLSIALRSVEADGGTLSVRDVPGAGCVFTIGLPRQAWP